MTQVVIVGAEPTLRWIASRFAPLIRNRIWQSWIHRQQALRQGSSEIQLSV